MPITYTVKSKKPGGLAGENEPKYYPVLTDRNLINQMELANQISKRSTMTSADVYGLLMALTEIIPEYLMNGYNVKLDRLGTFSIHASAKGKDTPEEVSHRDITGLKMSFLPSKHLKGVLKQTQFKKKRK